MKLVVFQTNDIILEIICVARAKRCSSLVSVHLQVTISWMSPAQLLHSRSSTDTKTCQPSVRVFFKVFTCLLNLLVAIIELGTLF